MRKFKKGLVKLALMLFLLALACYLTRYQLLGYHVKYLFDNSDQDAFSLIEQVSPLVDKHSHISLCGQLSLQCIEWSRDECVLEYSNHEQRYILTVIYTNGENKLDFQINRSLKVSKPLLEYSSWNYDVSYFSKLLGRVNSYTVNSLHGHDLIFMSVDGCTYKANPVTGDYSAS